jgi:exosortase
LGTDPRIRFASEEKREVFGGQGWKGRRVAPGLLPITFVNQRIIMKHRLDERSAKVASLILLGGCVLWAQWPSLTAMADRWARDPRYAHGYFVPMFALALLWMRRDRLKGVQLRGSNVGLAFLGLGAVVQLVRGYYRLESLEGLALLPDLCGLCVLLGGWRALQWAWPSIAFLAFMIPLPWRVESALGPPLQFLATTASTYVLQTLGFMAFAEGFVIHLNEATIGVVEACSGLSMVITFIALSTAAALVVKRPLADRVVLVLSAIPVALLANIFRIVLTGTLHETVGGHVATTFYHDLAGWIMMPLALLLYWLEIAILSRLLIEAEHEAPPVLELMGSHRPTSVTQGYKPSAL